MGCGSCGTTGGCAPSGCKSNGTCGTSGCNKLNVYDWLCDIALPDDHKPFNVVEIRFKGSRKEFFRNDQFLELYIGDQVVVDSDTGYDVGQVSISGELVRLQLKKHNVDEHAENMKKIQRKAGERELERYNEAKGKEIKTLERARTIALELKLAMKISDIEFQGDGKKVVFFYTAESRVDFRELIKRYADEFKVRIEMRQIGYRQEAARLGGIGSCGRELCCSTWLTDFKQVGTGVARYQNLSINMLKLSGQCGRLKCCLNYELDTYIEALDEFPKSKVVKIDTVTGLATMQKVDILKRMMWFSYEDNPSWVPIRVSIANEFLKMNETGEKAPSLFEHEDTSAGIAKITLVDEDLMEGDLNRLDKKLSGKGKNQKKKSTGGNNPENRSNDRKPFDPNRKKPDYKKPDGQDRRPNNDLKNNPENQNTKNPEGQTKRPENQNRNQRPPNPNQGPRNNNNNNKPADTGNPENKNQNPPPNPNQGPRNNNNTNKPANPDNINQDRPQNNQRRNNNRSNKPNEGNTPEKPNNQDKPNPENNNNVPKD
ncbi:MAG: hypothetical protein H7321_01540 [Bacteroidia bacterium]|nr:hypothetical protein [Bacteroidia bacterium]